MNIDKRTRTSVYWSEPVTVVRPCTWFCKAHDGENKLIPYEESIAAKLEVLCLGILQSSILHKALALGAFSQRTSVCCPYFPKLHM